jgi:hypothetical protein
MGTSQSYIVSSRCLPGPIKNNKIFEILNKEGAIIHEDNSIVHITLPPNWSVLFIQSADRQHYFLDEHRISIFMIREDINRTCTYELNPSCPFTVPLPSFYKCGEQDYQQINESTVIGKLLLDLADCQKVYDNYIRCYRRLNSKRYNSLVDQLHQRLITINAQFKQSFYEFKEFEKYRFILNNPPIVESEILQYLTDLVQSSTDRTIVYQKLREYENVVSIITDKSINHTNPSEWFASATNYNEWIRSIMDTCDTISNYYKSRQYQDDFQTWKDNKRRSEERIYGY